MAENADQTTQAPAGKLKALHELHIELREVQQKLDRGPKRIKARQQFTAKKEQELESRKEGLLNLKKAADLKALQLKTNEQKILDLKGKLNVASSNKEYDIFRGQIEADTMANSVLEDEILEALDKVDRADAELKELEGDCAAARDEERRVAQEFETVIPELNAEAARLNASIKELEADLPGDVRETYTRLVNSHGSDALAPVRSGVCSYCNVQLSPQMRVELNSHKIVFCRQCGRLLYRDESES